MSVGAFSQGASRRVRPERTWEAADTVIAGSAILVSIIIGVFVLLCFQGYDTTIVEAKNKAQRAANVVAEGSRWVIASAKAAVEAASRADPAAGASLDQFSDVSRHFPTGAVLGIYDASGRLIGQGSSPSAPRTIEDRDYFTALRSEEWVIGSQEELDNRHVFTVAKGLQQRGALAGVVAVFVDGSVLERLAAPQDLGKGSTISIVRADGWVVARNPPLVHATDLSGTRAMAALTSADQGSYESAASPVDGVPRLVGFKQVPDLGYIALASVSQETALAGLWYSIWVVSLLLAPIALALLVGSFLTAKSMRRNRTAQRSLASALEHNEVLFKEIHHRVKNNLQSINSLLRLHPIPPEVRAEMSKRIFAMSAVHEHIYRTSSFEDVHVREYLMTLIENIRAGADPGVQVEADLDDIVVGKDSAASLGLILNEVLSNAFKHAFAGRDDGKVRVKLKAQPDGRALLVVQDNGQGFDPSLPSKGIGQRLVEGFAAQLGGEISHAQNDGYVFTLNFEGRLEIDGKTAS
ncbi:MULTISPECIES: histidine kinase dimerization/phosphoacceptor domain -containing protein [unclassified Devosia]|uniref:sensor histidine kinase n=1 Tax=unclassified Devosia TaxID=196773 RepID=UPI00086C1244|nr:MULTISPECIES: histidine kinase dimerization/phosphoacceptor domain -containing protein [unclassified Devosia]MBN9360861.1 ATP-binding protein [Devosia sp.]ODS88163.1 MAG: hypothetical protein ABS47_10430 [Devosia sp. SCN 66-27]OJX22809.1 MAG: hypothetical protein BGO83_18725 [Devosia sp. 66-14]